MTLTTLARNIIFHKELGELSLAFKRVQVKFVVLKGAALTEIFENYSSEREMEDIDILIQPNQLQKVKSALESLGYRAAKSDPASYINNLKKAQIDVTTSLWYLDKKKNMEVFTRAGLYEMKNFSGNVFHLQPVDFFIHLLAHACIHHAALPQKTLADLALVKTLFGEKSGETLTEKLKESGLYNLYLYYFDNGRLSKTKKLVFNTLARSQIKNKGYIYRFLFLKTRLKTGYLFNLLFPSNEFLKARYNLKTSRSKLIFRVIRPFLIIGKISASFLGINGFNIRPVRRQPSPYQSNTEKH